MASSDANGKKNACERCRRSKVRYPLDTFSDYGKCGRCFASDKNCVFITPPPRKPRRRTDARVTSLEKELVATKGLFDRLQNDRGDPASESPISVTSQNTSQSMRVDFTSILPGPTVEESAPDVIPGHLPSAMLPEADARVLFAHFVGVCLPQFPFISIKEGESFDIIRETKLMLFLATITLSKHS